MEGSPGTCTPVLLLRTPKPYDLAGLSAVWGLALAGLAVHMVWLDAPERSSEASAFVR